MRNLARDGKLGSGTAEAGPALDRARPTPYSGRESLKLLVPPQRRSHMGTINWSRVVLGGLLAGVVLNVIDWVVYGKVLAADFNAAMQALGKGPMTGSTIIGFVIFDFLFGIFLIWLYAAIRPRFGAGPRTPLLAGFEIWVPYGMLDAIGAAPRGPV